MIFPIIIHTKIYLWLNKDNYPFYGIYTMEYVNFSLLALQFYKYSHNLYQAGFAFQLEEGNNLLRDMIVISRQDSFKTFYFTATAYLWDRYRQFTLYTTNSGKYHFRLNPVDNRPLRIKINEGPSLMYTQEMPDELKFFGEEIVKLIISLGDRYKNDKLTNDSSELIN